MIFTRADWDRLATLFDGICPHTADACDWRACQPRAPYSGYKPGTVEAPNGDTRPCVDCDNGPGYSRTDCGACGGSGRVPNTDAAGVCTLSNGKTLVHGCRYQCPCGWVFDGTYWPPPKSHQAPGKRYLHVADKYPDAPDWARAYADRAYAHACRVATALGVPAAYYPRPEFGALRVLEYPAGAGSAEHTDFDLFTVVCWRETPGDLELTERTRGGESRHIVDAFDADTSDARRRACAISPGLHIGELGELVGLGPATPHRVPARPYVQRSIVYFAIPDHAAILPWRESRCPSVRDVPTVGDWLSERMARSRYEVKP